AIGPRAVGPLSGRGPSCGPSLSSIRRRAPWWSRPRLQDRTNAPPSRPRRQDTSDVSPACGHMPPTRVQGVVKVARPARRCPPARAPASRAESAPCPSALVRRAHLAGRVPRLLLLALARRSLRAVRAFLAFRLGLGGRLVLGCLVAHDNTP